MESIYEFIFDVDDDIINMINDLFRIVTLQIVTQGLFCLNNKSCDAQIPWDCSGIVLYK